MWPPCQTSRQHRSARKVHSFCLVQPTIHVGTGTLLYMQVSGSKLHVASGMAWQNLCTNSSIRTTRHAVLQREASFASGSYVAWLPCLAEPNDRNLLANTSASSSLLARHSVTWCRVVLSTGTRTRSKSHRTRTAIITTDPSATTLRGSK